MRVAIYHIYHFNKFFRIHDIYEPKIKSITNLTFFRILIFKQGIYPFQNINILIL